jgi:hypothetical protein
VRASQQIVVNEVNDTFIAPFVNEGGGRVRVGPPDGPVIAVDPGGDGGSMGFALGRAETTAASATYWEP